MRSAKSSHEHFVHDTKSQAKPATESHVVGGRPRIPRDLDKGLRRVFKDLCSLLSERRALSRGDVELIRLYCFVYDRHKRNVALLRVEGELVEYERLDSNGQPHKFIKENIRLKICSAAEKQMASILSQLGMTPTAKDRARPVKEGKTEEYAEGTVGWMQEHGELEKPGNVVSITAAELAKEEA
jgi:P27 family predicted phage terminase small subunit